MDTIENHRREIEKKRKELKDLENDLKEHIKTVYPTLYTIYCIPNNKSRMIHNAGIFSSSEIAMKYIPESHKSYQLDGNCTWSYCVVALDDQEVKDMDHYLLDLDKKPNNFPYGRML